MNIKLSQTLYDKITELSKKLGMPRTQVVHIAINDLIKANK